MSDFIWHELYLLVISFVSGFCFRACYDILLIHRRICRTGAVLTGIGDVLYWLFGCIYVFSMLYHTNDGIIRGFVLGGIFLGMLFYHKLISGFLVGGCCKILRGIGQILKRGAAAITRTVKKINRRKQYKKAKNKITFRNDA